MGCFRSRLVVQGPVRAGSDFLFPHTVFWGAGGLQTTRYCGGEPTKPQHIVDKHYYGWYIL